MADKFKFELVSPERLMISTQADMVIVPGAEGDFGVMVGHAPLISTIRPGIVEVHEDGSVTRLFVSGGFADVTQTVLTLLAEEAVLLSDVDLTALDQEIKNLAEDVADAKDPDLKARAEAALEGARAKRDVVAQAA
ncbi:F0F1 ATP synthase subunit epsilon [Govanella unica]|uniref:ATP synthase epsilon chain n=1 Tax=Govanella unica TaxID=2975056 RepID=A0A9X3TW14_9PROT|nr:F0F1 ATP synthase subunit epsilon [Govania unica]MDA5192760.1 F0F1 ATP synthase subunit epsilon [Govania unica]